MSFFNLAVSRFEFFSLTCFFCSSQDPLINTSSIDVQDFYLTSLMRTVANQNGQFIHVFCPLVFPPCLTNLFLFTASTSLDLITPPIWRTGPISGQPFRLEMTIEFPVQPIWMETTVLHRLTTAGAAFTFWLLPFWLVCWYIRRLVFSSGALFAVYDSSKYSMKNYATADKKWNFVRRNSTFQGKKLDGKTRFCEDVQIRFQKML